MSTECCHAGTSPRAAKHGLRAGNKLEIHLTKPRARTCARAGLRRSRGKADATPNRRTASPSASTVGATRPQGRAGGEALAENPGGATRTLAPAPKRRAPARALAATTSSPSVQHRCGREGSRSRLRHRPRVDRCARWSIVDRLQRTTEKRRFGWLSWYTRWFARWFGRRGAHLLDRPAAGETTPDGPFEREAGSTHESRCRPGPGGGGARPGSVRANAG